MLVKWIVCRVDPADRKRFDQAQRGWRALAQADGFVAQLGGWDMRQTDLACILALWRDEQSYAGFMADLHDRIVVQSVQQATYRHIEVAVGRVRSEIEGQAKGLLEALAVGGILRVADCALAEGRGEHFETVQRQIWNRAMSQAGGMAGGIFAKLDATPDRYLVATLWLDERAHADYVRTQVPALRERAEVEQDVATLTGYCVRLEPHWRVLPANR